MKLVGLVLIVLAACLGTSQAGADRLKDVANIEGVRPNQLVGYGLVVGLDGTGDQTTQTPFTVQSFINMMQEFGIDLPPGTRLQMKNIAAVAVHAELPAFAKPGQALDITVSSLGNAKSLRGGSLLMTPLKGADGRIYALAQGNLVVGGFGAEGNDGSRISVNIKSVGTIPSGARVERAAPSEFGQPGRLVFNLKQGDFTTAQRVARSIDRALRIAAVNTDMSMSAKQVINQSGPRRLARAIDSTSIEVDAPISPHDRVSFIALLENLEVERGEAPARVVINSRTGTIVVGASVRIRPVAVTHGSLTVTVSENQQATPGAPFGDNETVITEQSDVSVEQSNSPMFELRPGPSLGEIVQAINEVGAAPGDLMAILEAMKQAGALNAEIVVI